MRRSRVRSCYVIGAILVAASLMLGGVVAAGSTNKILSTNFTLVNLGDSGAQGQVLYYRPDGNEWKTADAFGDDTPIPPGGQVIYRQYFDEDLDVGAGSVVVTADQPMGAVVQIQARGQNPTSNGAYSGVSSSASAFLVPLAMRNLVTQSGLGNSQIVVQNAGSSASDVTIKLVNGDGTEQYSRTIDALAAGASFNYDLADENASNVPDNWYGSAEVTAADSGQIAVVANVFSADAMQTFNAFSAADPHTEWFVPLFTARLANSLSTVVSVQNVSGGDIATGDISLSCTPDADSGYDQSFTISNPDVIGDRGSYSFNPVTNMTIPALFYGSCQVTSSADIVAFVQMRVINTGEAAAYEAIRSDTPDTAVMVPLVAKRLANGFATVVTIQNLNTTTAATVDLIYTPSAEYIASGGSSAVITIDDVTIGAGGSVLQNHRLLSGANTVPELPERWYGTLEVRSDQPVAAFVQLTVMPSINPNVPGGDNLMAHNAFSF